MASSRLAQSSGDFAAVEGPVVAEAAAAIGTFHASDYAEQTPRGAATRALLIAIAEKLFAERGIEGVTLLDINKAAGQRNRNASHYHFGSKQGLIQVILDKHLPGIALRRSQLLDEVAAADAGVVRPRDVVRALLYPVAEKLFDADGGRDFIRINAQLVDRHALSLQKPEVAQFQIGLQTRLIDAFRKATPHLPEAVAFQRGVMLSVLLFDGLAAHVRMQQPMEGIDRPRDTEMFVRNMEDVMVAMLAAPLSHETEVALRQSGVAEKPAGEKK